MIPILTPEQAAAWDARASQAGIELATLMESAGRAAAAVLADRFGHLLRRGLLVAAGPGEHLRRPPPRTPARPRRGRRHRGRRHRPSAARSELADARHRCAGGGVAPAARCA